MSGFGNLNKVTLIGRVTKDPRIATTASQVKVANFGIAVNSRKKNSSTGQWDDIPMFIDVAVFQREFGKLVDFVERFLHKGDLAYIEGKLEAPREWTGQDGVKHISMNVVADEVQFLSAPKEGGGMRSSGEGAVRRPLGAPPMSGMSDDPYDSGPPEPAYQPPAAPSRPEEEIPF